MFPKRWMSTKPSFKQYTPTQNSFCLSTRRPRMEGMRTVDTHGHAATAKPLCVCLFKGRTTFNSCSSRPPRICRVGINTRDVHQELVPSGVHFQNFASTQSLAATEINCDFRQRKNSSLQGAGGGTFCFAFGISLFLTI